MLLACKAVLTDLVLFSREPDEVCFFRFPVYAEPQARSLWEGSILLSSIDTRPRHIHHL